MGLDMFLQGQSFYWTLEQEDNEFMPTIPEPLKDFKFTSMRYEIGYWRKHPDLHGYIVNRYNDGVDDCEDIRLEKEDIEHLIEIVKQGKTYLETTEGFFFGNSEQLGYYEKDEIDATVKIFEDALKFIDKHEEMKGCSPTIMYFASW